MTAKVFTHNLLKVAVISLAQLFIAAAPAFPLGLENAGVIVPTGMDTRLLNPQGFWYDNLRGYLVVANTHARQVAVLNRQGQALRVLGKKGEFGFPLAVAGTRGGTLYVAERGSESLRVLPWYDSGTQEEPRTLALAPYRRTAPVQPSALFVDADGNLLVADRGNRQILVFDSSEKFKTAMTDVGEPADIWVESSGQIFVADPGFGGIRVYSPSGILLRTIGSYSSQFREPLRVKALAVDRRGRIWVVEESGQKIKAIDAQGNLMATAETGLASPVDLALDDQDNLYVLEEGESQIAVFRIAGY